MAIAEVLAVAGELAVLGEGVVANVGGRHFRAGWESYERKSGVSRRE
jgi:hypothetical protein